MKKIILLSLLFNGLALNALDDQTKKSLYEQIKEKERELAVPRNTVPVEDNRFLIDSPIPKTAHHLPFLQTLLNIEAGSLPNPIGISFIGSHTEERYRVKRFNAAVGPNLGGIITNGLQPSIARDKAKIIAMINKDPNLNLATKIALRLLVNQIAKNDPTTMNLLKNTINNVTGAGKTKEWHLSEGTIETKTSALGFKADMFIFPFMQIFATAAYLHMEQSTNVGVATIPLEPIKTGIGAIDKLIPSKASFPAGIISNSLDGWMAMAGTNLAIGYKGFFASFMISGGYVQLDDNLNGVRGFVQKPFMYMAPRIGYSYHGIATIHFGIQRVELFGATEGKDLTASTGGLVGSYSVEVEKFPVNFLAGLQFNFARDLGLSFEYVGSPDTNGINAELAFRF